jgi:hypothetical protein
VWRPPELSVEQILIWADAWYTQLGRWPDRSCYRLVIPGTHGQKWAGLNTALQKGYRGLPGGSSLARLLAEHRGVRNRKGLPRLTHEQILGWADAFYARTGQWPVQDTHPPEIAGSHGEKWHGVDDALRRGLRGFPEGYSLAQLLVS